jgi:hypothetical protein
MWIEFDNQLVNLEHIRTILDIESSRPEVSE